MPNVIRVSKHGSQTPMFTLVQGDSNTKTVTFIVQRRDGAVDLSDLIWMLQIENSEGGTDTCALEAEERGSSLLMEWVCGWVAAATVGRTTIQLCGFDNAGVKQWSGGKYYIDVQERMTSEPTEEEQQEMTQLQELVASSVADTRQAAEEARSAAEKANEIGGLTAQAVTLPSGSPASAEIEDGVLTIGIPRGTAGAGGGSGSGDAVVPVKWAELNMLPEADRLIVLEAAQPIWTESVQTVLNSIPDGGSSELTIGSNTYTLRRLGEVHDSLMVRNGVLQVCHKITEAIDGLNLSCTYEIIPGDHFAEVMESVVLPCSVENLLTGKLVRVTYAGCGAYLDGVHDDYEAMYRAHYIGDLCSCDVIQHGGTIYKANSGWLYVKNHNVDLTGCSLKIDAYNRYGFYWLNANSIWTLEDDVLAALRPQMTEYSNTWAAVETGFPANGLFIVTHPAAIQRWNDNELTTEDRVEVVRHSCDGRVYSTVIDAADENTQVMYHTYPDTQITFRGCTLDIDIEFGSVAMYFMRCERSNAVIRDFIINPTRRTTMNIGYRGAVFTLNKCADITMENIKGINIAGRPRDEYPRGVAGYILNAVSILDLTVRDCNLLGYWGCVGLNGAKEITFEGCELNRVDIHDYFRNLTIDNCRIYGQTINFGYGKGAVNISNCSVMTDWVHQIVNLRCDYGRYFEGEINICNVDAVYTGPTHFDIVSGVTMFSAESAANTGLFMKRYPTVNVANVTLRVLKDSYAGYVFNMHTDLEDTIEIADKRKVVKYVNVTVYDENGDLQTMAACSLEGVVGDATSITEVSTQLAEATDRITALEESDTTQQETAAGFSAELNDYSLRLKALEDNAGSVATTDYLYYSKRTLTYAGANTNIRLTLPYESAEAIYKVTVRMTEGNDVTVTVTDWTTSYVASAGEEVYIKMASGAMSSGKVVIFAVYPGTNSGSYELIVERTAETDAYAGDIQVDFASA